MVERKTSTRVFVLDLGEPAVAEALFIDDGTVAAVGTRAEVLAVAGDRVPIVDIGEDVAYPGFIDAHAHWIGDRDYSGLDSPADALEAAAARGWTSISEQWIDAEKLDLLLGLSAEDALPLRIDAYLALNFEKEFLGDWHSDREPGPIDDRLRVRGLKIHLDHGLGGAVNWERADLIATIGRRRHHPERRLDRGHARRDPGRDRHRHHRRRDPGTLLGPGDLLTPRRVITPAATRASSQH